MFAFQYCPNRSSRVLEIEIQPQAAAPQSWDAYCAIYEVEDGVRHCLVSHLPYFGIAADSEQDLLDTIEVMVAHDIEQQFCLGVSPAFE
ncbi:MAG: hypothetical protein M0Q54_09200 [Pigmentiphaga sp.]|nr:hypothetical protein [Pigmentiphaga sp.]